MDVTTEVKVGLMTVVGIGLVLFAWVWTWDGVRPDESSYQVHTEVTSADGLWLGTPVRLAGVTVGSVSAIDVVGTRAHLALDIRSRYPLPADSTVELRSTGMLGDRYVAIAPGMARTAAVDGGVLRKGGAAFDLDALGRQGQEVATKLNASADAVNALLTDEGNVGNVERTLAQLAALTASLAELSVRNQAQLDATIANLRRLSETLDRTATATAPRVEAELATLQSATTRLDAVLEDIESITDRIQRGEGSLGALVYERELVERLDTTLASTGAAMDGVVGLLPDDGGSWRADAWTTGRLGLSASGADGGGTIGGSLGSPSSTWLSTELVAPPGHTTVGTLQLHQRLGPASLHLGMKEGAEGLGAAAHLARDRVRLQADAFDFLRQDGPRLYGVPNLRLSVRAEPVRHLWLEAAAEDVLGGLDRDVYGWVGLGVHATPPVRVE